MNYQELRKEIMRFLLSKQIVSVAEACRIHDLNYTSINNQLNGRTAIKLGSFMELVQAIDEKFTINKEFKIVRR